MNQVAAHSYALKYFHLDWSTKYRGWITTLVLEATGSTLDAKEFRDALCLHFGMDLGNFPLQCDMCGGNSVDHSLLCKKGGKVLAHHDQVEHKWRNMCTHALGNANIVDKPHLKIS